MRSRETKQKSTSDSIKYATECLLVVYLRNDRLLKELDNMKYTKQRKNKTAVLKSTENMNDETQHTRQSHS